MLLGAVLLVLGAGTTAASAATFTYDVLPAARFEIHQIEDGESAHAWPEDSREESASPSAKGQGTSTTPDAQNVATNSVDDVLRLGTKDSWGKLNTLDDHFARHGADFGATSADDYARQASEFLQRPGNLTKIDPKTGVIRVYDPATEAFGAYNPTGTTRTFYVPDPAKHGYPTNLDYWNAQPG